MSNYVLPLFPVDTVAASVTTTVWVGVCVVAFFNLRLGWNLSGLVVPGYLVPLMIAKPVSAVVILLEAVTTYLITRWLSESGKYTSNWSSLFGRDRFFALVVVSVLVRSAMDCWMFPRLGNWLDSHFGLDIDHRNDLHSYGLIIVALMANYFWKSGVLRGLPTMGTTVAIAYLIVRYVLMPFTNFNVGGLHYVYDDIASSMLASPKSYIILLTTAFLASWINLRYGWEFNGILIPALLAFQWYAPWKIVMSFVEAGLILAIGSLVLRMPFWRGQTMEGPRKILVFFSVAFLYRMAAGHLLPLVLTNSVVTDYYGFGYLLSTLLAIKARDLASAVRVAKGSIQVSLVGAFVASLIGFMLTWVPSVRALPENVVEADIEELTQGDGDLVSRVRRDKRLFYQQLATDRFVVPNPTECQQFSLGIGTCLRYCADRDPSTLAAARRMLAGVRYEVDIVDERYLYLRERTPANGWGLYVIDTDRPDALSVHVPFPLYDAANVDAGLALFYRLDGGSLAIAGTSPGAQREGWRNQLSNSRTLFAIFYHAIGHGNVIQLRGSDSVIPGGANRSASSENSTLWVRRSLPPGLRVTKLRSLLGAFSVEWKQSPWSNILRDRTPEGFSELVLNERGRRPLSLLSETFTSATPEHQLVQYEGYLSEWLREMKHQVARRGANTYVPPTPEELLYVDEEVLKPLLSLTRQLDRFDDMTPTDRELLARIATTAAVFHFRVILFHDSGRREDFVILTESTPWQKHWGICVLRLGPKEPFLVEVPRPLFERNAFEFGLAQFSRQRASSLLIAGAHPMANLDDTSDVVRVANRVSFFHLVHQAILRGYGELPMLVVQTRAIRAPVSADVVIAAHDGSTSSVRNKSLLGKLERTLTDDGMRVQFADGSPPVAGYEIGLSLQALTMDYVENKDLVGLWLSPSLRTKYRQPEENRQQAKQFDAVGIPTVETELFAFLSELDLPPRRPEESAELQDQIEQFIASEDIVRLRRLQDEWPACTFRRLIDRDSGQVFLVVSTGPDQLPLVANLSGGIAGKTRCKTIGRLSREGVADFVDSRSTWLIVRDKP